MNERIIRTQAMLRENGQDALLVCLNNNVLMLSGYLPINGMSLVFVPVDDHPVLIAPRQDERFLKNCFVEDRRFYTWGDIDHMNPMTGITAILEEIARENSLTGARIAHEGRPPLYALPRWTPEQRVWIPEQVAALQECFDSATWTDLGETLIEHAGIKTNGEVEKIRQAHRVADLGLQAFREAVQPGRTEVEIAAGVEGALQSRGHQVTGADFVRGWAHVMSGVNAQYACQTYNASTPRQVQDGELVLMELGVVVDGYWADLTRVQVAGKAPSQHQREVFQQVWEAQNRQVAAVQPGAAWADVDAAGRGFLHGASQDLAFPHITGHGVGFCYHELTPFIGPDLPGNVHPNQIVAIEPGLYGEGFGGLRLESNFLVTETGAERLDDFQQDLDFWQK